MLFVLSTAFGVFGTNPISGYLHSVIAYLPLVFIAIVILVLGFAIAAAAKALIENSLGGLSYGTLLANAASTVIIALFAFPRWISCTSRRTSSTPCCTPPWRRSSGLSSSLSAAVASRP